MKGPHSKEIPFNTSLDHIQERIAKIDPVAYGKTRNFIDGAVSYLSPYISRGVISTKQVLRAVLEKGYSPKNIEKFVQELAWRDYWQQVWIAKGNHINSDIKRPQPHVENSGIPEAIVVGKTGIEAMDTAIESFYKTGYLHNHVRMYIASLCCTMGKYHWYTPAKWMYYHLLDGDWASNALSWQWVAGANSNKQYYANQENINRFCYTTQKGTYLDAPYEALPNMGIPSELSRAIQLNLETPLPEPKPVSINPDLPTLLYNFYNLDPYWKKDLKANRILLLEPSHFEMHPISEKSVAFMLELSTNIEGIQIFVGEFDAFLEQHQVHDPYFKEHPLNKHYNGIRESRDWMFSVKGYYPSFFAFWKRCKKELMY